MSITIEVKDLFKSYTYGGHRADILSGVNFTVEEGQNLIILGPSGSGKSTLLNLLSLLDRPDKGELTLLGTNYSNSSEQERRKFREKSMGFIFQSFHLIEEMTAMQNIALPGRLLKTTDVNQRTHELLERVNLMHVKNHRPHVLSGGERQRVAVARALFHRPQFIFADEPTGNLDAQTGSEVMSLIRETCEESGAQMILVTHNEAHIQKSDRVIFIESGKVFQQKTS